MLLRRVMRLRLLAAADAATPLLFFDFRHGAARFFLLRRDSCHATSVSLLRFSPYRLPMITLYAADIFHAL